MSNITIQNMEHYTVFHGDKVERADKILFPAAATYKKGTLLGRKLVSDTIAVTPGGGNTGDYTLVASARPGRTLKVGTYTLVAGDLTAGVGPWTLTDPDGDTDTFTTAGGAAGDDLSFEKLGVNVVVTVVTTAFADGDNAALVVSAQSGTPHVAYSPTGTNGAQNPSAALDYEIVMTAGGTRAANVVVSGTCRKDRLVIHADGDADNITAAIEDQMRVYGLIPVASTQLAGLDNQ